MSFKTSKNFTDFLNLYASNPDRVIFFVGAGLSMPLFPGWKAFLEQLVNDTDAKSKLNFDKQEMLDNISNGSQLLEIADYCADSIGKNEYREIIEKNFDKEFKLKDIPIAYTTLLTLQFKSIITTNYDRIPEIGGHGNFSCYTNKNISEGLKAIEKGKKIVLKIHGDILNHESIVLTQEDFKTIIHNNIAVQTGLKSLFSTSTICFVGFGFHDPHFNLILDFLNTINSGKNIIHYALLSCKSKFEIHSIEKRYGIRVIEYIASDNHPEVNEFFNELKGLKTEVNINSTADTIEELFVIIENSIQLNLSIPNYYLDYDNGLREFTINYFTRASTEYETQKEILSLYRLFNLKTSIIETIKICCFALTDPSTDITKFSPLFLTSYATYSDSYLLANKTVSESNFWKNLIFNQPNSIGNIYFTNREVNFPYINF